MKIQEYRYLSWVEFFFCFPSLHPIIDHILSHTIVVVSDVEVEIEVLSIYIYKRKKSGGEVELEIIFKNFSFFFLPSLKKFFVRYW